MVKNMKERNKMELYVHSKKMQRLISMDDIHKQDEKRAAVLEGTSLLGWMNHGGWEKSGW